MNLWCCDVCRKTYDTRERAYLSGCGTWGAYVLESSIVRTADGRVMSATVAGEIHHVNVTGKVNL